MLTRPADLSDELVGEAVHAAWGLDAADVEYAPVGFGSYHWRVTADDQHWFVTADDLVAKRRDRAEPADDPLRRLSAALRTARSLVEAGLDFVVAPRTTTAGAIVHAVGDAFALALYPLVDGDEHSWGPYPSRGDRLVVLDLIAALHAAPQAARRHALVDDLVIPHRDRLEDALDDLAGPWDAGPIGESARVLLEPHAGTVVDVLSRYDQLAAAVALRSGWS